MSMKKLTPNWLAAPTGSRIRKSKTKSKRYSEVLSVCSTSWFASPAELDSDVPGQPEECSKAKGSGDEGGPRLRRAREFGSTGDLLDCKIKETKPRPLQKCFGGSLEQLAKLSSNMTSEVGLFRTETGADVNMGGGSKIQPLSLHMHTLLENPESETRWYFKYFLGKYHLNFLCSDLIDKNPLFLSVVPSDSMYRCILWSKTGNKRLCVNHSANGKWPAPKSIVDKFGVKVDRGGFKAIMSQSIQKDLLTLEEQEGAVNFKFGVIYAKAGQKTDNDMYCNEHGSQRFTQFLELLGDEVQLRGWKQFRGGLDTKNDSTGLSSVYTVFEGHEVMFHVSTLLPYSPANEQQLERKRHIGNDIVVIIFVDYDRNPEDAYRSAIMDFDPSYMRSHFNHIFALVTYNHLTEMYRLVVHTADSVPSFGPPLPAKGEFTNFDTFRDFLLAKLINGEKAVYCTPTFAVKRERTLGQLLDGVEKNYSQEMRRAVSTPALNHSPNTYKKFNEKESLFTEYGQRLKVEKIITGLHPTSQRTTVTTKREPWETECVVESFPFKIACGDSCGNGTFMVHAVGAGTYLIFRDGSYSLIMDQSVSVTQLVVAHKHQIVLFRTNYPKEVNYMYAIPLKQFYSNAIQVATKSSISRYQVPHSKGVCLFCTSHLGDQFLRLAVAVKNKVYMLAYKHPATFRQGSPATPGPVSSVEPKDNFIKHRELSLLDVPAHMTLLDERPSGKLCVTYHKLAVVDAIDEIMATTQRIPNLDIAKTKLTTLTSVQSGERSELLLGHNFTSQLISLHDHTAYNSMEIAWNSEPVTVTYLPPYMLAFTEHTVEIRMASNGSLMQTINVPDLKLLSSKDDLYFVSSSGMVHTCSTCKTPTSARSFSNIPSRLPKNVDPRDLSSTNSLNRYSDELYYIYKISMEHMMGMRELDLDDSESSTSFRNSSSDEESVRSEPVNFNIGQHLSNGALQRFDFIHPVFPDDGSPLMRRSFQEELPSRKVALQQRRCASYGDADTRGGGVGKRGAGRLATVPSLDSDDETSLQVAAHDVPAPILHSPRLSNRAMVWPTPTSTGEPSGSVDTDIPPPLPPRARDRHATPPSIHTSPAHASPSSTGSVLVSPPNAKLKRSRKVLTGRKSLDSPTSKWLQPSPSAPDGRQQQESDVSHETGYTAQELEYLMSTGPQDHTHDKVRPHSYARDTRVRSHVLGELENVVYSSTGVGKVTLSSSVRDIPSNSRPHP